MIKADGFMTRKQKLVFYTQAYEAISEAIESNGKFRMSEKALNQLIEHQNHLKAQIDKLSTRLNKGEK